MKEWALGFLSLVMLAAIVGLLLQTTLFHLLPIRSVIPDVILVLCVYLGLHQHSFSGTAGAFLLGYFTDSFAGNVVGLHAFAMTLVFLLVYLVSRRLWMDNWVSNLAMVFVASVLKTLTIATLLAFYVTRSTPWGQFFSTVWIEAGLAALFAPLVFSLLDRGRRTWSV